MHQQNKIFCRKNRFFALMCAAVACVLLFVPTAACSKAPEAKIVRPRREDAASAVSSRPASSAAKTAVSSAAKTAVSSATKTAASSATKTAASSAAKTAASSAPKGGSRLLNVKNIQQMPELQSGCEITAANIVLNHVGYNPEKTELVKYIPCSNDFYTVNGKLYGPNPWKVFAGDPASNHYGCYAPVLANAVNAYILDEGGSHTAVNLTGTNLQTLYKYVNDGFPVVVWVTVGMEEPSSGDGWYLDDTGASYHWVVGEHCMVLIGYNKTQAIFSDPLDKRGTVAYDKTLFETRYRQMSSQAIAVG